MTDPCDTRRDYLTDEKVDEFFQVSDADYTSGKSSCLLTMWFPGMLPSRIAFQNRRSGAFHWVQGLLRPSQHLWERSLTSNL